MLHYRGHTGFGRTWQWLAKWNIVLHALLHLDRLIAEDAILLGVHGSLTERLEGEMVLAQIFLSPHH